VKSQQRAEGFWRSLVNRFVTPAYAQDSYSGDGGFVVWSEWYDGTETTWEGNVYVDTGDGGSWSIDNQFQVDVPERTVLWTAGEQRDPDGRRLQVGLGGRQRINEGCSCFGRGSNIPSWCIMASALWDATDICGAAAGMCRARGPWFSPRYWECAGFTCGMATAVNLIRIGRATGQNCRAGM